MSAIATPDELLANFLDVYDCEAYRRPDGTWMDDEDGFGHGAAHALLVAAQGLTGEARKQFSRHYSFELALEGTIYVGSERHARAECPDLLAQAPALGIKLVGRGGEPIAEGRS